MRVWSFGSNFHSSKHWSRAETVLWLSEKAIATVVARTLAGVN